MKKAELVVPWLLDVLGERIPTESDRVPTQSHSMGSSYKGPRIPRTRTLWTIRVELEGLGWMREQTCSEAGCWRWS